MTCPHLFYKDVGGRFIEVCSLEGHGIWSCYVISHITGKCPYSCTMSKRYV